MTRSKTYTAAGLDDRGFPLVVCGRCDGSGNYSWNAKTGTRCFGCEGKGVTYTPAVLEVRNAYSAALSEFRKPCAIDVKPGDVIYGWFWNGQPLPAREVVAVSVTPKLFTRGADVEVQRLSVALVYADGEVEVVDALSRVGRRGKFDGQPFRDAAAAVAGV